MIGQLVPGDAAQPRKEPALAAICPKRLKCRQQRFLPHFFGLCAGIFCQVFINMGMAMGVLPVVGVTLPFFSYGGSSLLASMIAIGLLMNISMRRFTF